MKKVILALAIVSVSFAACNNSGETPEPTADSTKVEAPVPATTDSTATAPATTDSSAAATPDSTKK